VGVYDVGMGVAACAGTALGVGTATTGRRRSQRPAPATLEPQARRTAELSAIVTQRCQEPFMMSPQDVVGLLREPLVGQTPRILEELYPIISSLPKSRAMGVIGRSGGRSRADRREITFMRGGPGVQRFARRSPSGTDERQHAMGLFHDQSDALAERRCEQLV